MDELEKLKQDVQEGRVDATRLVELLALLQEKLQAAQEQLQAAQEKLQAANQRIADLEKQFGAPSAKLDQPFSTRSEEKRQDKRRRKKTTSKRRRGRLSSADKIAKAQRHEQVYPADVDPKLCKLSHVRPVWRFEHGRAILIAYEIFRGPGGRYGEIPGVLGRSEFGLEIVITVAHLIYSVGLSFGQVCELLHFFQDLQLSKAQANYLLRQLARVWSDEFDILCTLLANSAIVNTDETSWSINSVWAFLSEKVRLLIFGVHKDAQTLQQFLDLKTFLGVVISDDAAVYANFSNAQKCWAHLLRKAIKLTLLEPKNQQYRDFTDRLLELYRQACRVQQDGRLGDQGRKNKVEQLEKQLVELCYPTWAAEKPTTAGPAKDFDLLVRELMRLWFNNQLFTFVTAADAQQPNGQTKPAEGTNNEAERTMRNPAQARKTGRTNKTAEGAKQRTIISSVLQSLRLYLDSYTLPKVIEEVSRWSEAGKSCFEELLEELGLKKPDKSVLEKVIGQPDG